ncbi:PPC domain-containing protein [Methanotrichaceae archaeon M04Ac]|jgi:hypothetical protein|uniref:PPC domain-containing protein n=1 Tax=Candidatus Methanocrinis alkalitolerans TaxID=3033395 RepID=A0ABT5XH61_9EURY|nr:PPC domain-containing protein [Candidatus Methanocrinis alkalitolerans]MDF0594061.1 PPC domain-containing protein [Candidatus Methanocrinis alkalitolerans]
MSQRGSGRWRGLGRGLGVVATFFDDRGRVIVQSPPAYCPICAVEIGAGRDPGLAEKIRAALRAESESLEPISGYILAISFPDLDCDEEPNDSPEEALDIGVLTSGVELTISGCILPGGDVDYYAVVVEEPLDVVVETSGSGDGDSVISLYDGEKEEIARDDDGGEGTWSKIAELLEPGAYYLKVEAYGGGTITYDLSVAQA